MMPLDEACTEMVVGVVSRVGDDPALFVEGRGEIRFAYRNVKKWPSEPKPLIVVGDVLDCKLYSGVPVVLRVLRGGHSGPASLARKGGTAKKTSKAAKGKKAKAKAKKQMIMPSPPASLAEVATSYNYNTRRVPSEGGTPPETPRVSPSASACWMCSEDGDVASTARTVESAGNAATVLSTQSALMAPAAALLFDSSLVSERGSSCDSPNPSFLESANAYMNDPYCAAFPVRLVRRATASSADSGALVRHMSLGTSPSSVLPLHYVGTQGPHPAQP